MVCWSWWYWGFNPVCLSGNYQECRALHLHWGLLKHTHDMQIGSFKPATSNDYVNFLLAAAYVWEFQAHSQPLVKESLAVNNIKFIWVVWSLQNQFFCSSVAKHGVKNQIVEAIANRIIQAHKSGKKFRVIIVLPQKPEFAGKYLSKLNRK